jgi:hypothetical protein
MVAKVEEFLLVFPSKNEKFTWSQCFRLVVNKMPYHLNFPCFIVSILIDSSELNPYFSESIIKLLLWKI